MYRCAAAYCPPAHNGRAIVWAANGSQLQGMLLPSRRRFEIAIPPRIAQSGAAILDIEPPALTGTTLFVQINGRIYATLAPR
jgi:hypothetical protein